MKVKLKARKSELSVVGDSFSNFKIKNVHWAIVSKEKKSISIKRSRNLIGFNIMLLHKDDKRPINIITS